MNYDTLAGRTVAILGSGLVGSEVSKLLEAFNVKTVAKLMRKSREDVNAFTDIDELLNKHSNVDYLINILPSTPKTKGILSRDRLQKLQKCTFINVGRGRAVANEDVIFALDEGYLSKAILDVFPVEPLPEKDPLWSHLKVVLTPHNAGIALDKSTCKFFLDNLERFLKQEELVALVDTRKGY